MAPQMTDVVLPAKLGPIWGRVSALVNIGLWSGVAWGGRWIGFWG